MSAKTNHSSIANNAIIFSYGRNGVKYRDRYGYKFAGHSNPVAMPEEFWFCGHMNNGKFYNKSDKLSINFFVHIHLLYFYLKYKQKCVKIMQPRCLYNVTTLILLNQLQLSEFEHLHFRQLIY